MAHKCTICSITHDTRQELTLHNASNHLFNFECEREQEAQPWQRQKSDKQVQARKKRPRKRKSWPVAGIEPGPAG